MLLKNSIKTGITSFEKKNNVKEVKSAATFCYQMVSSPNHRGFRLPQLF